MRTLQTNPELMTVICNIQAMRKVIYSDYNEFKDFKILKKMTDEELHIIQDKVVEVYNMNVTIKQMRTI
jgi:hypothetical protein